MKILQHSLWCAQNIVVEQHVIQSILLTFITSTFYEKLLYADMKYGKSMSKGYYSMCQNGYPQKYCEFKSGSILVLHWTDVLAVDLCAHINTFRQIKMLKYM